MYYQMVNVIYSVLEVLVGHEVNLIQIVLNRKQRAHFEGFFFKFFTPPALDRCGNAQMLTHPLPSYISPNPCAPMGKPI